MSRLDPDIACSSPAVPVHSTTRLSKNTETGTKVADLRFDLAVFSTTKFRDREAKPDLLCNKLYSKSITGRNNTV